MNRKLRDALVLVAACLTLVWCIPSAGQVLRGSITGTVTDPEGAVVSGAQVKATQQDTGAVHTSTTDSSGVYHFNLLPASSYKLEISAPRFKTAVQSNVLVSAGAETSAGTVKLSVGEASTTVEVTAEAPLIETSQGQVTNTFSGTTLTTFSGIQENQGLDNLALFVPGVSAVRDNAFSNTNGGMGFSVNGLRGRNNDQQIDGQNNNDNSVGGPSLFASNPEFVGQYVLVTDQFGPEYGRNAGSVVNIITKSGGNAWHGSIYASENNSVLNSLTNAEKNPEICAPDCLTKPPRLNDEFGGFTIGGPWIKNKLFVFGGFDQEIISQQGQLISSGVTPTPAGLAQLAGCFPSSQSLAALLKFGPYAISGGNPTPNGAVKNQDILSGTTLCSGVPFAAVSRTVPQPSHIFDWIVRMDWQFGGDSLSARFLFNRNNAFNTDAFATGASGYTANVPDLNQQTMISWTHPLSSRMVNEARLSFGRLNTEFGGNSIGNTIPSDGQLDQALAQVTIQAAGNLGFGPASNSPQGRIVNTWQAIDNWNYVLGRHALKAGVNFTYQRSPNIFLPNINGTFRFPDWGDHDNPAGTGCPDPSNANCIHGFFSDQPNRVRIANGPSGLDFREYDTFLYFGDDWKLSQTLTLNLGLTWSYYGQPANLFNDITTKRESNPATAFWGTTDRLGNPIPLSVRTDPTIPAPKNSFGPSVGFAYSPQWGGFLTGHGKTVFRGGYRMAYDPPFYNIYLNTATSAPEVFLQSFTGGAARSQPMPAIPTGPNVRAQLAPFLTKGVLDPRSQAQTLITPDFGPDKVQRWSFGFERELAKNAVFEARYAGNHAGNQFQTLNANPFIADLKTDFPNLVPAGLTPCAKANAVVLAAVGRVNCNEGIARIRTNTAFSNYNALQTEFRANNLFKQLTVRSSYTYSKNLDNSSEIFSTTGGGNTTFFAQNPANQLNFPGEYSFSGLDFRHQWSLTAYEQLPFFKAQHGLVGHVFGGWGVSANYVLGSGQRYNPTQVFEASSTANGDYYDNGYIGAFAGFDTAHTFLGNLNAPATAVGIFAGDACPSGIGVLTTSQCAGLAPSQLISYGAANNGNVVSVTKDQVRFIVNAAEAQSIFGTPFGNTPRNPVTDAITNTANLSIIKNLKFTERSSFEFHATFVNAFNHPNFQTIDPFVSDAGLSGQGGLGTGFGDPSITNTTQIGLPGFPATRRITFYGVFRF
jgi:Carboxypeptidase regulatory-like domain